MTDHYFKITNKEENHKGFQYVDGLNILDKPFEETGSCVPGGLYFSNAGRILDFLSYGIYLREIYFPSNDPDFKIIQDPEGTKWRANKIILGEKRVLADVSTWEYLFSLGAKYSLPECLPWALENGAVAVIKMLLEKGEKYTNILTYGPYVLCESSKHGYIEIVEYLIGENISANDSNAIECACKNGHFEIVKFLFENGANLGMDNNSYAIRLASANGHIKIVKFLAEKGADFEKHQCFPFRLAAENGHLEVVKFFIEIGVDIHANCEYAVRRASHNNHLEVVKFLISKGANVDSAIKWISETDNLEMINFLNSVKKTKELEVVKYFISKGANVNSAIKWILETNHLEMINFLNSVKKSKENFQ